MEIFFVLTNRLDHSDGLPVLATSVHTQVVASDDEMFVSQDKCFVHRRFAIGTASRALHICYSDLDASEKREAVTALMLLQELFESAY